MPQMDRVVVFTPMDAFSCDPESVSSWNLHLHASQFSSPDAVSPSDSFYRSFLSQRLGNGGSTKARLYGGQQTYVSGLKKMNSICIELRVNARSPIGAYIPFVIFNRASISSVSLFAPGSKSLQDDGTMMAILSNVYLPGLRSLTIFFNFAHMVLLREFLARHPLIRTLMLSDCGISSEFQGVRFATPVFPSLSHPGITKITISCYGDRDYMPTLLSDLKDSPKLAELDYSLTNRPSKSLLQQLVKDLKIIAGLPRPVTLTLCSRTQRNPFVPSKGVKRPYWYTHKQVRAVARSLHPIDKLCITVNSVQEARRILSFAEYLPALTSLRFIVYRPDPMLKLAPPSDDEAEVISRDDAPVFAEEFRTRLGGGVLVDVDIY
ncbi:hypothetical protein MIND_00631800 [Mycena indigotica]|uniref:Uncharacterized protein n=1 Tax=Mycena indigotica TaxID=2126181 RepID=A0A8H6W5X7_9AGAR|nr:uncharacterized protein MIND_00631800 [Mycena indigotica]KAF7304006.1 hypothetical protein MIND_00631800 [Mycena indigotica]